MHVTIFGIDVELDESTTDGEPETIRTQVAEYERGERRSFDLEVRFPGGVTGDVMRRMVDVPYGETRSYGAIATEIGTSPIAVGQACGRNPVPLVVPCHRIVGADSLGGFSAGGDSGRALKRQLIDLERSHTDGGSRQTTLGDVGTSASGSRP